MDGESSSLASQYSSYGEGRQAAETSSGYGYGSDSGGGGYTPSSTPAPTVADQYASYGGGRAIAEHMAGYGEGATPKSEWQTFVDNSPSFQTSAKLVFGALKNPLSGMFTAGLYNADRLSKMTEAERYNESNIRAEIDANRVSSSSGSFYGALVESPNAFKSISRGVSSGVSGDTGRGFVPGISGAEKVATRGDETGAAGSVVVASQSGNDWAKWAAIAGIAGVVYEIYKG